MVLAVRYSDDVMGKRFIISRWRWNNLRSGISNEGDVLAVDECGSFEEIYATPVVDSETVWAFFEVDSMPLSTW